MPTPAEALIRSQPVCVGFLMDKLALGQAFLFSTFVYSLSVISQIIHTPSFIYRRCRIILASNSVV